MRSAVQMPPRKHRAPNPDTRMDWASPCGRVHDARRATHLFHTVEAASFAHAIGRGFWDVSGQP
ncbi:hypothetical protein AGR2A_Lc90137 [Agrobacterium genomosp. 2 str. CFBP 5494]|uniref:Uncharacterized protein n=1 Tax=Agrobacterium genomosp. 2 str. CFBP 5494 TaxID=1183436 RepID=A0A9W5B6C8_9HYPH|nr:hypothetical protein AGR2A_Lc90137 [Agrobacterium genomosp. 2 str. CFBP 5494]